VLGALRTEKPNLWAFGIVPPFAVFEGWDTRAVNFFSKLSLLRGPMRVFQIGIAGYPPLGLESPLFMRFPENHVRKILMSKNLKVKI
jgi:hypothetical protein